MFVCPAVSVLSILLTPVALLRVTVSYTIHRLLIGRVERVGFYWERAGFESRLERLSLRRFIVRLLDSF